MKATVYLHASKETMYAKGEELGLTGEALNLFMYTCYEVKVDLEVSQGGCAQISHIDGRAVAPVEQIGVEP